MEMIQSQNDYSLNLNDNDLSKIIEDKKGDTLNKLCQELANKNPDKAAIVHGSSRLSFRQLHEKANWLALFLIQNGIKAGNVVGIAIDRSPEMIIAILGILRAGGVFLPIDAHHPHQRVAFMLADSAVKLLLVSQKYAGIFSNRVRDIVIDDILGSANFGQLQPPDIQVSGNDPAYIIYTSGSTGNPKAVVVEHQSICNYIHSSVDAYATDNPNNSGSFLHLALNFDASLTAVFVPLVTGKTSVISSREKLEVFDDENLVKYAPYDFIKLTPAQLPLLEMAKNKKAISATGKYVVGGEALHQKHLAFLRKNNVDAEIINEYGPTEATVGCISYRFHVLDNIPDSPYGILIGKPMPGVIVYILDALLRPVPVGAEGEIYIGGVQVARGYINRAELTSSKFIKDPGDEKARIYATGDIGRYTKDGDIEYMGRMDDQVKIRGYRIELGEIESAMLQGEMIETAVVLAKDDNSRSKTLISYYIPNQANVRAKEQELGLLRVANWKTLYEIEYGQTEADENIDAEFNIIGWNDSFTNKAIPAAEMQEWLQDIVDIILMHHPKNVLEIGCGTGLIFYQLAGKINKYIGRDLSRSSINQIKTRIARNKRDYGITDFQTAPAHEVTLDENEEIDTVVLNSMVQYFPGESYMNTVIEKALLLLKGKGRIIVGDVRDNRLLKLFKARLYVSKMEESLDVKELNWVMEQETLKEEELCFSPVYFHRLKEKYPEITHVEIQVKKGAAVNELTLYRYNVIIYVGITAALRETDWKNYEEISANTVQEGLVLGDKNVIAIKKVPNPRLWKERILNKAVNDTTGKSIGELLPLLEICDDESLAINGLLETAVKNKYYYRFLPDEDPLKINLLFEKYAAPGLVKSPYDDVITVANEWHTNIPLFTEIGLSIQKEVRSFLKKTLPDYMIPSEFIPVQRLPLTSNGKIDRKFLSQRKERIVAGKLQYLAPQSAMEKAFAGIWQEIMDVEKIGVQDNFFDLGGHSLMAMRLVAAMAKQEHVTLTIRDLFVYPTIAGLASFLQSPRNEPGTADSFKSLVQVKSGTNKMPLYIVCGSGGTVYKFKDFANMLADNQPVFGLQQPFEIKDATEFPESIEGIAAKYISEILIQNPNGPYALAGHCLGGLVAFEMTKQLEKMGKKVSYLATFDTILEKNEHPLAGDKSGLLKTLRSARRLFSKIYSKIDFELFLWRRHTRQAIRYKIKNIKKRMNPLKNGVFGMEAFEHLTKVYDKAGENYRLKRYDVNVEVFYAKERYYFMDVNNNITYRELILDKDVENMWHEYARSVNVHKIDGEHSTIFEPAYCKTFADLVQNSLDKK